MNQRRAKRKPAPAGLRELQEAFSAISLGTPGRWFAVELRQDYVRVRLRERQDGREVTLQTMTMEPEVLQDALRMEREEFRLRVEGYLKRHRVEI
jgi:hypothetical protein